MSRRIAFRTGVAVLGLAVMLSGPAGLQPAVAGPSPLAIRNSFRVGDAGVTCTAQNAPGDARLGGMFDRSYRITCRDAAGAVGTLLAVRRAVNITGEPSALHGTDVPCGSVAATSIDHIGQVQGALCHDPRAKVDYRRYAVQRGSTTFMVEGLAGYDPALRLALASVVKGAPVAGEVRVATTEVSDPAAFARIQAGQLDSLGTRDEGYLRNNGGRFAESAEFFEALSTRERAGDPASLAEALANQGLQQSNLANFAAAERLFDESARVLGRGNAVAQRLLRNYRALNRLNQNAGAMALAELAVPVDPVDAIFDRDKLARGEINLPLSEQINRENATFQRIGGVDPGLTPADRAELLDAQAEALRGTALRLEGKVAQAAERLQAGADGLARVRGGQIASASFLTAEIQIELALVAEAQGLRGDTGSAFDRAIAVLAASYPESPALLAAQARKAAWLVRSGDTAGAKALFAAVVDRSASVLDSGATLRELLSPYFSLLASEGDAASAAAMFRASQVLQRPGVAQTQAVLARQMSAGNDEAAAMFRLSVVRSREIARMEAEAIRLAATADPAAPESTALRTVQDNLAQLRREQTELVSRLAGYSRYNAIAPQRVTLEDLQGALTAGEGYYKLMAVDEAVYALFVTANDARSFRVDLGKSPLSAEVQAIRDSIVKIENGRQVNYPFDLDRARTLYGKLFGPLDSTLPAISHLIFEPDGAMLQLPPSVLVTSDSGIAAYKKRAGAPDGDAFDFTGIEWFGRKREMSIAVSPRGFLDLRKLGASRAARNYLGLGQNATPAARPVAAVADECDWPLATWQSPIAADELAFARQKLSAGGAVVKTGSAFSDSALLGDGELDQYRILHFATHGLVTAPRPDCPARPALVTSFGAKGSDGLLSFREIFDLKLDADLVILSACDTAGLATVGASREAGVTSGGNYALDGLVRAFVGAGARTVIASHWPVPDDFDATRRLIAGVIEATPGQHLAGSLAAAQARLMDDPNTSHPFYWAAFIILGDGAKPLVPVAATVVQGTPPAAAR